MEALLVHLQEVPKMILMAQILQQLIQRTVTEIIHLVEVKVKLFHQALK